MLSAVVVSDGFDELVEGPERCEARRAAGEILLPIEVAAHRAGGVDGYFRRRWDEVVDSPVPRSAASMVARVPPGGEWVWWAVAIRPAVPFELVSGQVSLTSRAALNGSPCSVDELAPGMSTPRDGLRVHVGRSHLLQHERLAGELLEFQLRVRGRFRLLWSALTITAQAR